MPLLPPQSQKPAEAGSGFTNLNRYLQANKTNQLGNVVSSGVQQAGESARGALNQAGQEFQTQAQKEKDRLAQQGQKVDTVLGNVPGASDEDIKQFESIRGAQSLGPTGVANADELRSKAGEAETLGRASGSQAGRFGLLQRFVGGGGPYSMGQQRMDQMLLGQTGGQQLKGARASTYGLGNQVEQKIGAAQEQGKELQGQARQLAESTVGKLGEQVGGYDAAMQAKLAAETGKYSDLLKSLGTPGENAPVQFDAANLKKLSDLTQGAIGAGTELYNSNLSPFLSVNQLYANKQGVQSTDDLAKAQMLEKLSGNSLAGKDAGNTLQDYVGHPELAGQFAANNPFALTSRTDLMNELNSQKATYDREMGDKQASIAPATRFLTTAGGGQYSVTGGSIGDFLRRAGALRANQPNAAQYEKDNAAIYNKFMNNVRSNPGGYSGGLDFLNQAINPEDLKMITDNDTASSGFYNELLRNKDEQEALKQQFHVLRKIQQAPETPAAT